MDDNTAVIPVITREPVVYATRARRFYNAVNRVWTAGRRFLVLLLDNAGEDFRDKTVWLERATLRVASEVSRLRLARQYSATAKHKRRMFASCPVRWKLERERYVNAATPLSERRYGDEDSRFEGLLQQTRAWQQAHNAGSAAR